MKFHEFPSLYIDAVKQNVSFKRMKQIEFYDSQLKAYGNKPKDSGLRHHINNLRMEREWNTIGRPYYNVWPILLKASLKLDLSKIRKSDINFPENVIAIRFSEEQPKYSIVTPSHNTDQPANLHSMMIYNTTDMRNVHILAIRAIFNNDTNGIVEVATTHSLTSEDIYFKDIDESVQDAKIKTFISKIAVMLGIITNNPDFITPDYIKSDIQKITEQTAEHYQNRAKKAGKYGWNIGESLHNGESSPHFRNPHLALYWTGEGGQTPVVKLRTGPNNGPIPVRRDKITTIPTGYHDKEPQCQ